MEFTIEQVEDTLDRIANIGAGVCWSTHMSYDRAQEIVSFSEVILLEHLGVPKTLQSERAIKGALQKGIKVYYYMNGHARDVPTDNAVLHFDQT